MPGLTLGIKFLAQEWLKATLDQGPKGGAKFGNH